MRASASRMAVSICASVSRCMSNPSPVAKQKSARLAAFLVPIVLHPTRLTQVWADRRLTGLWKYRDGESADISNAAPLSGPPGPISGFGMSRVGEDPAVQQLDMTVHALG